MSCVYFCCYCYQDVMNLSERGIPGRTQGRLYFGTAETIPPSELVDTTGAGDAFIGAVLYGKKNARFCLC